MRQAALLLTVAVCTLSFGNQLEAQNKLATSIDPGSHAVADRVLEGSAAPGGELGRERETPSAAAGPYQLPIPWSSFVPIGLSSTDYASSFFGWIKSDANPGDSVCFGAPVELPNGAEVTHAAAYGIDNSVDHEAGFWLFRQQIGTNGGPTFMADHPSTSSSANVRVFIDDTIVEPIINNFGYQYYAYTCLRDPNHYLYTYYVVYNDDECGLCGGHLE